MRAFGYILIISSLFALAFGQTTSDTNSNSNTGSWTNSNTGSWTNSNTGSWTNTVSPSSTSSNTNSNTGSWTNSNTGSWTNSNTGSWTNSNTNSNSVSVTKTVSDTPSWTSTDSKTDTPSVTGTGTGTATGTGTGTPSRSATATITLPPVCGNARVEKGEQCDPGTGFFAGSTCCNDNCQFKNINTKCGTPTNDCFKVPRCRGTANARFCGPSKAKRPHVKCNLTASTKGKCDGKGNCI